MKGLRILFRLLILISIITGIILILFHPYFHIQTIEVNGETIIPPAKIDPLFTRFEDRHLVFTTAMLYWMAWHPPLLSIDTIHIQWKSIHHITVTIIEKKPVVGFLIDKTNRWVSQDGTILNPSTTNVSVDNVDQLPIINGVSASEFQTPQLNPVFWQGIQAVLTNIHRHLPNTQFQIVFKKNQNIIIMLHDTLPILIGQMTDINQKFQGLNHFLQMASSNITTVDQIDLRIPGYVTARYSKTPVFHLPVNDTPQPFSQAIKEPVWD